MEGVNTLDTKENIKILMADDEPDVLRIMAKRIAREGYRVVTAEDGQEAVDKIKSEEPDLILLDINMPKKNGFEVLKEVRDNPHPHKWQPVIIISARRELNDFKEGFNLEADHYMAKPCSIEEILKSIERMIQLMAQRKDESKHNFQ